MPRQTTKQTVGVGMLLAVMTASAIPAETLAAAARERAIAAARAQRGGQRSETDDHLFEVVYHPQETRVYLFRALRQPLSRRQARGEVVMRLHGNSQVYRYPLQYVPAQDETRQDYLVARPNVTRMRDGRMDVRFELTDLPSRNEPNARFTQEFALSRTATVTVAKLTDADRVGIARQGTCPVMDTKLGEHGRPIKLLVGGRPLYLCCKGCINKVRKNPELYLRKVGVDVGNDHLSGAAPSITVIQAVAADRTAIRVQGTCPVSSEVLGGHGTPLKVTVDGRSLFVCCRGCIRAIEKNPTRYLAKASGSGRAR